MLCSSVAAHGVQPLASRWACDGEAVMSWKPVAHRAAAGAILGVALYMGADSVGELTTFVLLRRQALALAEDNEALKKQIGEPYTTGPWYNARIGFSRGANIAMCSFQLQGTQQITDVTVRGIRKPGVQNTFLYNAIGAGEWSLIDCTAMFPSGGGLVKPQSLMPPPSQQDASNSDHPHGHVEAQTQGKAASVDCAECGATKGQAPCVEEAHTGNARSVKQKRAWWKPWG
eukprot:365630-Chlamydomonas_euryale.AAC.28